MTFILDHLIPAPLEDQLKPETEIWDRKQELSARNFVQIVAPSGKGKSTLIQILYGNRKDYTGNVIYGGKKIRTYSSGEWAEVRQKKISIVFQELLLFSELTGWENILVKLRLTQFYKKEDIDQMTDHLQVSHLMNKKCGQMSFGERQRIAIIRSLVQPFEWLLLDEPFSHLDEGNTKKVSELITKECQSRQAGLIITSLDGDRYLNFNQRLVL